MESAVLQGDKPLIIGCSKDLMESVARAVVEAKNVIVSSNADFDVTVTAAHQAIERQAGPGLDMGAEVRTVASSVRKVASAVRAVRNAYGTGHGRATTAEIEDELATVMVDASLLWCRWALRRLGHVLRREPQRLVEALQTETFTRFELAKQFEADRMPQQPADLQRALGAAFAQRWATGDTFIAKAVGIDPAVYDTSLTSFPVPYREGLAEGLTLDRSGHLQLTASNLSSLVAVLQPVPAPDLEGFLRELAAKVQAAGVAANRMSQDLAALSRLASQEAMRFSLVARPGWTEFVSSLRRGEED